MQGAIGLAAPAGTNAAEALREAAALEPEMVAGFYRAAGKVMRLLETEMNRVGGADAGTATDEPHFLPVKLLGDLSPARRHLQRIRQGVLPPTPAVLDEIARSV